MQPFRIYRKIEKGEFFLVGGDCSQGGADSNVLAFLSRNRLDYPITYKKRGVAATMTPDLHEALEFISDITGVRPVVALERNNGGGSEMERLRVLNKYNKYRLYTMKKPNKDGGVDDTGTLGYETTTASRPVLIGEYKQAFDTHMFYHYDNDFIEQHHAFIVGKNGKPQAASNRHDDAVIAPAISWQLYQTELPDPPQKNTVLPQYQPVVDSDLGF